MIERRPRAPVLRAYYLSMAKVYDEWINKITKLREDMREYEEMVSRLRHEKETEQDQILNELLYIKNRINTSAGILTDKTADWIVDLGPEGGDGGGKIIAEGTPEEIAADEKSYTGHYLKTTLGSPGHNSHR